ncbi:MAG: hypothetical protein P8P74_09155 [Crocinitomicaceae bacterium]|nr:hypothetical protein [Crocinitomicaceae bacterium]
MKRFAFSFILLTGLLFTFTQCGSADAGEKTANKFFSAIIKKDFKKADAMMFRPIGDTTSFIPQLRYFENNPTNGQLLGFKKSIGFNTEIVNGVTTVKLPYTLKYESGDQLVNVVIEDRGAGNKILSVQ